MKMTVLRPTEIEVTGIKIVVPCRYADEDIPYDFPFRKGDVWSIVVDGDTGKIRGWPRKAGDAKVHIKVVDEGSYYLLGPGDEEVAKIEGNYVPECIPQKWGDYIDFKIDAYGVIAYWKSDWTAENILDAFFKEDR